MKNALLIGTSRLISVPNKMLHLWYCRECGNLFNALQNMMFSEMPCPLCHKEIKLSDIMEDGE